MLTRVRTRNSRRIGLQVLAQVAVLATVGAGQSAAQQPGYLTSEMPLVLLSANDGESGSRRSPVPLDIVQDSITVIRLTPDTPPISRTVYGTVPNSIFGSPRMAIVGNGRYGIVSNNTTTIGQFDGDEEREAPTGLVSVIDLASDDLEIVATFELPGLPQIAVAHPDDERFFVNTFEAMHIFRVTNGLVVRIASVETPVPINSFDISPDGELLLASSLPDSVHVFRITADSIQHQGPVGVPGSRLQPIDPFTPRISPSGDLALVLNGGGNAFSGALADVLVIDMTTMPPQIVASIPDVADGLEGVAIHPEGHMAVIGCLDDHLAVIDLTADTPRLMYYLDRVGFPEGLEFSPDGSKLFVGLTARHQISVYDVDGFVLHENPLVLRAGHGPSSLALSQIGN